MSNSQQQVPSDLVTTSPGSQPRANEPQSPFVLMRELSAITTFSPQHLYKLIERGEFPKPIKLGLRRSAWLRSFVDSWVIEKSAGGHQ